MGSLRNSQSTTEHPEYTEKHKIAEIVKEDDSDYINDGLKRNIPRKSAPPVFSISKALAMSFILGLMFGPHLALGSPTQNYPSYRPNSNSIDFREVKHKRGIPPKLEQLLANKKEYKTVQAEFLGGRNILI